jgi:ABC-type spermidine/putrescine transport system permease subunit I
MSVLDATLDQRRISRLALFVHRSRAVPFLLLLPCAAWIVVFFLVPLGLMTWRSVSHEGFSLAIYGDLVTSPQYVKVMVNSLKIVMLTTIATLLLGYPVAYALTMTGGWARIAILTLVTIPYWVDVIVRSFSWLIVLGDNGILNRMLMQVGLTGRPLPLLYNLVSVLLGMTQILLPMMIITLFGAMLRIDRNLLLAAKIHGATEFQAFRSVFFPLSLPGVYGASLLVFVIGLGFYVTPALLGSPGETMISQTLMNEASENLDYERASAGGVLLLLITLAIVAVYNRYFGLERLWGGTER